MMRKDVLTPRLYAGETGYSLSYRPNVHVKPLPVVAEWSVAFIIKLAVLGGLLWCIAVVVMA